MKSPLPGKQGAQPPERQQLETFMSRTPHEPTDEQRAAVETMAGYGIPHDDIAKVIRIDPTTMRRWYREELDRGHAVANTKVAQNLFKIASGAGREAVTACIFWLKCRAGWRETGPIAVEGWAPVTTKIGKKEEAEIAARTAGDGTEWGDDLRVDGKLPH